MKDAHHSDRQDKGQTAEPRKPFVPPRLRREAELTKLTAERFFTFNGGES